jgi:hypothetical protein
MYACAKYSFNVIIRQTIKYVDCDYKQKRHFKNYKIKQTGYFCFISIYIL